MLTVSPSVIRVCVLTLTDLHMRMPRADFVVTPRQRFKMTAPRPASLPSGSISVCWRIETLDKQTREPIGVFAELRRDIDTPFKKAKLYIPRLFLNSNNLYRFISIMATPTGAKPETHVEEVVCMKAIPPSRGDVVQTQHSLMNIIGFASVLSPVLAGLPLMMLYQVIAQPSVSIFIVLFWLVPIVVATRINQYNFFPVYILYVFLYLGLLLGLLIDVAILTGIMAESVFNMLETPAFWCELIAEVALCNVVLGDLLYVNLFKYAKRTKPPTQKASSTANDMTIETAVDDTLGETDGGGKKKRGGDDDEDDFNKNKGPPVRKNPWENSRPVKGGVCPNCLKCRPCRRIEPRCQKLLSLCGVLHCWIRVCLGKQRYMERLEERKQRNPYKWRGAAEEPVDDPLDIITKIKKFINRKKRASPNELHILVDKETLYTIDPDNQSNASAPSSGGGGEGVSANLLGHHEKPSEGNGESRVNSWNPSAKAPPPPPELKKGANQWRAPSAKAGPNVKTMVVSFNPTNAKVLGDFKMSRRNVFPPKPIGGKYKRGGKPPPPPRRFSNSSVSSADYSMTRSQAYEPSASSRAPVPPRSGGGAGGGGGGNAYKQALSPSKKAPSARHLDRDEKDSDNFDPPSYAPTPTSVMKDSYMPPSFSPEPSKQRGGRMGLSGNSSAASSSPPPRPLSPTHRSHPSIATNASNASHASNATNASVGRAVSPGGGGRSASPGRSAGPGYSNEPSVSHARKSSKGAFCTGCGRPFSGNEKFCIHCGVARP